MLALALPVVLAACGGKPPSIPPPSVSASAAVVQSPSAAFSPAPTSATPSETAGATPIATPAPTATPVPTPCPVKAARFVPPSDRLLTVSASTSGDQDLLIFGFGNPSIESPGGPPKGEFSVAKQPYTEGASGRPIKMQGDRVVQIVYRGMSLQADTGDPVYQGTRELQPDLDALKHAVEYDESEGVIGWYAGFDGPGCITVSREGKNVIVAFAHAS